VQDVPAAHQGENIRRIVQVLDIDRVRARCQAGAAQSGTIDVDLGKDVGFRVLQPERASSIKTDRKRNKPVALLGVSHAELVHQVGLICQVCVS
jgi:hypothetical protein